MSTHTPSSAHRALKFSGILAISILLAASSTLIYHRTARPEGTTHNSPTVVHYDSDIDSERSQQEKEELLHNVKQLMGR